MLGFRRIWVIFAQLFIFSVVGLSKCKSLYLNEREECYGRHAFNPNRMVNKCHIRLISENTLQEMLSNPHEFVCFGS